MPRPATLGRAFVEVFAVSTAFPVIAALLEPGSVPQVVGLLDVAIAAITVVVAFALDGRVRADVTDADRAKAYRWLRIGAVVLLVLLGTFFLTPGLFAWDVLVIGLAWRAWLITWVLPSVIASLRR
jgi:hypothetical protein